MPNQSYSQTGTITESIRGIVDRVTYHNPDNGWSVLRVLSFNNPHQQETVIVHQTKVFAGATMEFHGAWIIHPKFGRQFKAIKAVERKPATTAALEKYLGSGLIKGVGPKTAKKIVHHFGKKTLDIFEEEIERLTEIKGIAQKKLEMIGDAWIEHRAIREVMMFLQHWLLDHRNLKPIFQVILPSLFLFRSWTATVYTVTSFHIFLLPN